MGCYNDFSFIFRNLRWCDFRWLGWYFSCIFFFLRQLGNCFILNSFGWLRSRFSFNCLRQLRNCFNLGIVNGIICLSITILIVRFVCICTNISQTFGLRLYNWNSIHNSIRFLFYQRYDSHCSNSKLDSFLISK